MFNRLHYPSTQPCSLRSISHWPDLLFPLLPPVRSSDSAYGLIFSHARHPGVRHTLNRGRQNRFGPAQGCLRHLSYRKPSPRPPPLRTSRLPSSTSSSTFHPSLILLLLHRRHPTSNYRNETISDCVIYHHHHHHRPPRRFFHSSPFPSCGA